MLSVASTLATVLLVTVVVVSLPAVMLARISELVLLFGAWVSNAVKLLVWFCCPMTGGIIAPAIVAIKAATTIVKMVKIL
jgi:hypothetical protein